MTGGLTQKLSPLPTGAHYRTLPSGTLELILFVNCDSKPWYLIKHLPSKVSQACQHLPLRILVAAWGRLFAALADNPSTLLRRTCRLRSSQRCSTLSSVMSTFRQTTPDDVVGKVLRRAEVAKVLSLRPLLRC